MSDQTNAGADFDQERAFTAATGDWRGRGPTSRVGAVLVLTLAVIVVAVGAWMLTKDSGNTHEAAADSSAQTAPENEPQREEAAEPAPLEIGVPVPDFSATALDGTTVQLSELRGRPIWLLFGMTMCGACRSEQPDVQAAAEKYAEDVLLVAVYPGEDESMVADYSERLGITYLGIPDPAREIADTYRIKTVPAHYFIDAEGILQDMEIGVLHPTDIDAKISALH